MYDPKDLCCNCQKPVECQYGRWDGKKVCLTCMGQLEMKQAQKTGKYKGYLIEGLQGMTVSNFTERRLFKVICFSRSVNNWGHKRIDVWFRMPFEKNVWHGFQIGNMNQVVHAKRTKRMSI